MIVLLLLLLLYIRNKRQRYRAYRRVSWRGCQRVLATSLHEKEGDIARCDEEMEWVNALCIPMDPRRRCQPRDSEVIGVIECCVGCCFGFCIGFCIIIIGFRGVSTFTLCDCRNLCRGTGGGQCTVATWAPVVAFRWRRRCRRWRVLSSSSSVEGIVVVVVVVVGGYRRRRRWRVLALSSWEGIGVVVVVVVVGEWRNTRSAGGAVGE